MNAREDVCKINRRQFMASAAALSAGLAYPSVLFGKSIDVDNSKFHFAVTSDCHMYASHSTVYKDVTCMEIMKNPNGPGDFVIVNGDMDPFTSVKNAIDEVLIASLKEVGKEYCFYPAVGNHDLYNTCQVPEMNSDVSEKTQTRAIIEHNKKSLKNIVNWGPEFDSKLPGYEDNGSKYTNYSFDHKGCHFIVIDLYYANSVPGRGNGNFHKVTAEWLEKDLQANKKEKVFVFGHEPVIPYTPQRGKDITGGLLDYHADDLWQILTKYKVDIYFCGHTHAFGVVKKDGVTQINSGISGIRPWNTYLMIFVDGDQISYKSYVYNNTMGKQDEFDGIV